MPPLRRALRLALVLWAVLAAPAVAAEDEMRVHRFGDDLYVAGDDVRIAEGGLEDVFAAGEEVAVSGNVAESVHALAGRVRITGSAGRDVYAAARRVELGGPVAGDITAFGERVQLTGSAGADVVLGGRDVEVSGPVSGGATLLGETVEINAPISGSVQIRAANIRFGPAARIDGTLEYWSPNAVTVPAQVIPADRVIGVRTKAHQPTKEKKSLEGGLGFGLGVLVTLALAALFSLVAPRRLEQAHEAAAARPWLSLGLGLVAVSGIFGSILVLAASIIGIPLVPVVILLAPIALLAGYLTAAFSLGRLSLGLAKVRRPDGFRGAFAAMATGVLLLAVVRLIPIFGWVVLIVAVMAGLGAWFATLLRPREAA